MNGYKDLIAEARELAESVSQNAWTLLGGTFEDYHFLCRARTLVPELCDALEKALNEVGRLQEARRWVPTSERLPDKNGQYLCVCEGPITRQYFTLLGFNKRLEDVCEYEFEGVDRGGFYDYDREAGFFENTNVSYWMPLPEPPEKEGETK